MTGKNVIVTGSESGIGKAAAGIFLDNGARVIGLDRNNFNSFADKSGYTLIQIDLIDIDKLKGAISKIEEENSGIDILVNCAGVTSLTSVMEVTPEEWDSVVNINLRSMFFCSKFVLEGMIGQKKGKIVNISSNAGKGGGEIVGPHYSISKAGVISLTITLAQFAAKYNINVNCVAPGPTETSMTSNWSKDARESLMSKIPLRRLGKPEDVAEAIFFLSSSKADFITGEILDVNGGLLMD